MNIYDIAIATITLARSIEEETLLKESLRKLALLNIPVLITDGGSSEEFLKFIESFPTFSLLPTVKGLWSQTHSSLTAASQTGRPFIFYTEPDKIDFFTNSLLNMLKEISVEEQTGVFLASRSSKGFATFPPFQQMTETTINTCCKEIIGEAFDYVYGPFLLNNKLLPLLESLPENIGWGWRPYAFNMAKRNGYLIGSYEGDFLCPIDQREDSNTERIYRMRQMNQNIEGLVRSTQVI